MPAGRVAGFWTATADAGAKGFNQWSVFASGEAMPSGIRLATPSTGHTAMCVHSGKIE